MNNDDRYITLASIHKAQHGDAESQTLLADSAKARIYSYILRLTLDHHLAEDLCQDTLLEMVRFLPKLKIDRISAFWAWLYQTALSKVQQHIRKTSTRNKVARMTNVESSWLADQIMDNEPNGLSHALQKELFQTILEAMTQLKVHHRNVIALRCFDQLSYAEIAAIMGSSQLRTKQLFFRATQSLKRQLRQQGYKKSYLLPALGLFATATLSSGQKASAAAVISSCSLEVSGGVAVLGALSTKLALCLYSVLALALAVTTTHKIIQSNKPFTWPQTQETYLIDSNDFAYPSHIVNAALAYREIWYSIAATRSGQTMREIDPNMLLVGERPESDLCVVLPSSQSIELGFAGPVIDGPGPDIFFVGWGCQAIEAQLTDGKGRTFPLPLHPCTVHPAGFSVVSYDLQELGEIPFEPNAIRLKGGHPLKSLAVYRLSQVRARIKTQSENQ